MEGHEDPVRAREAVRRAAWQGAKRLLGIEAVLLVLAAILYPAFNQIKVGPKLSPRTVAGAIQAVRRETGRWPVAFDEVRPKITFDDRLGPHRVSFVKTADRGEEAEYVVAFDRSLQAFRLDTQGALSKLGPVASGTLPR